MPELAAHKFKLSDLYRRLKGLFALPNEDPRKIVAVAVTLCLVSSLVVSAAAVGLRPLQKRNESLAFKREILKVAGLYEAGQDINRTFAKLDARLVNLETGEYVTDMDASDYDMRKAAADPERAMALSAKQDVAGIRTRAEVMPVYLLGGADNRQGLIIPVYGYGLWSTMYGLLSLAPDARTIRSVSFYDQLETAGLGGEVANPKWQRTWAGKKAVDEAGNPRFEVVKGRVDMGSEDAVYQVDGLSGATLTSNGVTNLMRFWMGELGYGPYLARLRSGSEG